jgi:hypothetical protein
MAAKNSTPPSVDRVVNDLSVQDRLEFSIAAERFRNAQLQVQNAQLALEVAQMRWDIEKNRIKTTYNLQDADQVDPNSGKILRA